MEEFIIDTYLGELKLIFCFDIDSNRQFYEVYDVKSNEFLGEIPNLYDVEDEDNKDNIINLIETYIYPF